MFQSRIHNQGGGWYLEYKWKCKRYDCKPNKDYCCTTVYYFFKMGHINNQTVVPTNCTYCADESKVTVLKYSFNHRLFDWRKYWKAFDNGNYTNAAQQNQTNNIFICWPVFVPLKREDHCFNIRETNPVWQLFLENFELTRLSLESHSEIYTIIHAAIVV